MIDSLKHRPFWFVWSDNGEIPHFKHSRLSNAEDEARRLALKHPGNLFIVLESICGLISNDVTKIDMRNEIPF